MNEAPRLRVLQGGAQTSLRTDGRAARRRRIETALSAGANLAGILRHNRDRLARRAADRGLRVIDSA